MPNITWADFGVVGLVIAFILALVYKIPDIIDSIKNKKEGGKQDNEAIKVILENNTQAVRDNANATSALILYLKTRDAGSDVENSAAKEQQNRIEQKIDKLTEVVNTHNTRCETTCHTRQRG